MEGEEGKWEKLANEEVKDKKDIGQTEVGRRSKIVSENKGNLCTEKL